MLKIAVMIIIRCLKCCGSGSKWFRIIWIRIHFSFLDPNSGSRTRSMEI